MAPHFNAFALSKYLSSFVSTSKISQKNDDYGMLEVIGMQNM